MTTQLCSRSRLAVLRGGISAVALFLVLVVREGAMATPVAQAYGTACLTQMPMPNAFGRGRWSTESRNATGVNAVGDAHDRSRGAERLLQLPVASADPAMPYEVAVFGENGAPGFTGSLNFRCENATATGSNSGLLVSPWFTSSPMQPAGLTVSSWKIGSAPQMVEHDHGTVNFTYYQTNQGFGAFGVARLIPTGVQTGGGPGFSYAPKSVHAFLHHGLAAEPAARPLDPHAVQAAAVVAPEMNA